MKKNIAIRMLSICLLGAPALPAFAQLTPPTDGASAWKDFTLSGNIGLSSQYRFRGLMQTNNKPAIQGGFDLAHSSGFYIGNWNSNVSSLSDSNPDVSAPIEMDFYGGYTGKIGSDFTFDAGVIRYYYPGDYPDGYVSPDTTELYIGAGYGPISVKYSHAVTNLFGVADSKNSQYYEISGHFPTPLWGLAIDAHVGYQHVRNLDNGSYTDWSAGLKKEWNKGLSTTLSYIDTNANKDVYTNTKGRYIGKQAVVLEIAQAF